AGWSARRAPGRRRPGNAWPPGPAWCRCRCCAGTARRWRFAGSRASRRASRPACPCPPPAVPAKRVSLEEPFVVALHELTLDLFDRIQTDANHDQNRCTAERQVLDSSAIADLKEEIRQHRDYAEVDRPRQGNPVQHITQI